MKKAIKTTNYDGTVVEVEVNIDIYNFYKEDYWKQDYRRRKNKQVDSYERLCECFKNYGLPNNLQTRSFEKEYLKALNIEKLFEAIDLLPKKQRRRIILRFFDSLTLKEIAEKENISISTLNNSLNKALIILKKYVEKFFGLGGVKIAFFTP